MPILTPSTPIPPSVTPTGLTRGDILEAVIGFTENRLVQRQLLRWLDVDIAKIVHRKRYWWRKLSFFLSTIPGIQAYDLNQNGAGPAPDLEQMVNLCWLIGAVAPGASYAYLADSSGQQWQISVDDFGNVVTAQTSGQTAAQYVMQDVVTGLWWTMTISTIGVVVPILGAFTPNPLPNLTSPSYTWQMAMQNGILTPSQVAPAGFVRTENTRDLGYEGNAMVIQSMLNDPTMGQPDTYFFQPGRTQSVMIGPIPDAIYLLQGIYWAGYNPGPIPDSGLDAYLQESIPLIPPTFHYCVLLALLRRCFLYLYGSADLRYKDIQIELEGTNGEGGMLGDLDRINHPSIQGYETWQDRSGSDYVRSDRN